MSKLNSKPVTVATYDGALAEAIEKTRLREAMGSYSYAMVFKNADETYTTHFRFLRPCFGELRPYGLRSRPEPFHPYNDVGKPSDLPFLFPEGEPTAVVFALPVDRNEMVDAALNPETSPWRACLRKSCVDKAEGSGLIAVIEDTDFEPTIMVSLMKTIVARLSSSHSQNVFSSIVKAGGSVNQALLGYLLFQSYDKTARVRAADTYCISSFLSFNRFLKSDPYELSPGTWRMRVAYDRPKLADVFGGTATDSYKPLLDFLSGGVLPANSVTGFISTFTKPVDELSEEFLEFLSEHTKEN